MEHLTKSNLEADSQCRHRWHLLATASLSFLLVIGSPAWAHKTFLASERVVWSETDTVTMTLSSALAFPDQETGVAEHRIEHLLARTGAHVVESIDYEETATALRMQFEPQSSGFSTLAVSTYPRSGEIAPGDVDMYFDELGAAPGVRAAFDELPGSPALMRSYSKHTKIFFCVDVCESEFAAAAAPTGQALEFTAADPGLRRFVLLRNGQSLPDHAVAIHSADGRSFSSETDADGEFELDPAVTGSVLLSATWIDLPRTPDGNYHSDQATLSVTVG